MARLAPEQKIRATLKVIGGPVYRAHEIERLLYDRSPRDASGGPIFGEKAHCLLRCKMHSLALFDVRSKAAKRRQSGVKRTTRSPIAASRR